VLMSYAVANGIKINQVGDWERGKARTLYLGSRKSAVQLVMYEKGYETGSSDLDWVRLEVRVYPKKDKGYQAAAFEPNEFFGTTWVAGAIKRCGLGRFKRLELGTVYRPSDAERARRALCKQYGNVLLEWIDESASPTAFTDKLHSMIEESRTINQMPAITQGDIQKLLQSEQESPSPTEG